MATLKISRRQSLWAFLEKKILTPVSKMHLCLNLLPSRFYGRQVWSLPSLSDPGSCVFSVPVGVKTAHSKWHIQGTCHVPSPAPSCCQSWDHLAASYSRLSRVGIQACLLPFCLDSWWWTLPCRWHPALPSWLSTANAQAVKPLHHVEGPLDIQGGEETVQITQQALKSSENFPSSWLRTINKLSEVPGLFAEWTRSVD